MGLTVTERVDALDLSLFDHVRGGTSRDDRRSLLAVHAAMASRGDFRYLEIGSYLGTSLQSFVVDPRCVEVVSIDRRDDVSSDEREVAPEYPDNTTENMLARLSSLAGADLQKLTTIDASTDELDPTQLAADVCFIDAEHTNSAALRDARFCRKALRDRGVIVFHDRTIVEGGIRQFLSELSEFRAYPLAHDLFVVELGIASLLDDPRVREQVPRRIWFLLDRFRAVPAVLRFAAGVRVAREASGMVLARKWLGLLALLIGAPRRRRRSAATAPTRGGGIQIYTFVNDDAEYVSMRQAFEQAGFSEGCFTRLSDASENPFSAINRIARESSARYAILCHQDVRPDRGAGAPELQRALEELDRTDPQWSVAGTAGVMRSGRVIKRVVDPDSGFTGEALPLPVATLDEHFLVFNMSHPPSCSAELDGFHLYGADACMNALAHGGGVYIIDFPLTHLGRGNHLGFEQAKRRFQEVWSRRERFCYVLTTIDTIFLSRSELLRRRFGSPAAISTVAQHRRGRHGEPLSWIDRRWALQPLPTDDS